MPCRRFRLSQRVIDLLRVQLDTHTRSHHRDLGAAHETSRVAFFEAVCNSIPKPIQRVPVHPVAQPITSPAKLRSSVRLVLGDFDFNAYWRRYLTDEKRRRRCIYVQGQKQRRHGVQREYCGTGAECKAKIVQE